MKAEGKVTEERPERSLRQSLLNVIQVILQFIFWLFEKLNITKYSIVNAIDSDFEGFELCDKCNCSHGYFGSELPYFQHEKPRLISNEEKMKLKEPSLPNSSNGDRTFEDSPEDSSSSTEIPKPDLSFSPNVQTKKLCVKTALSLSLFSKLAYESPSVVQRMLQKWGFHKSEMRYVRVGVTQSYVAANDHIIMVAFRGTAPLSIIDYLTDASVNRRVTLWGKIHHGFMDALDLEHVSSGTSAFNNVMSAIEKLQTYDQHGKWTKKVYFAGHSLGGALATCFIQKLIELKEDWKCSSLYTFGSPMCGDPQFVESFSKIMKGRSFRFVHNDDLIARLPPSKLEFPNVNNRLLRFFMWKLSVPMDYGHVEQQFFFDTHGTLTEKGIERFRSYLWRSIVQGKMRELSFSQFRKSEPFLRKLVRIVLPPFLNDHFPGDYVRILRKMHQTIPDHCSLPTHLHVSQEATEQSTS